MYGEEKTNRRRQESEVPGKRRGRPKRRGLECRLVGERIIFVRGGRARPT